MPHHGPLGDLRSPRGKQQYSIGILLDVAEPDIANVGQRSSPVGHWLSVFIGKDIHIRCWASRAAII